jgi:hypothetical protein
MVIQYTFSEKRLGVIFTNTRFLSFVKIGFSLYGSLLGDPNKILRAVMVKHVLWTFVFVKLEIQTTPKCTFVV